MNKRPMQSENRALSILILVAIITSLASFAAWLTHVIVCFKTGAWIFLIAGAIAFPVGVIHGIGIWIGIW